jgi:hypothetical protein
MCYRIDPHKFTLVVCSLHLWYLPFLEFNGQFIDEHTTTTVVVVFVIVRTSTQLPFGRYLEKRNTTASDSAPKKKRGRQKERAHFVITIVFCFYLGVIFLRQQTSQRIASHVGVFL